MISSTPTCCSICSPKTLKKPTAPRRWFAQGGGISVQVLNEAASVMRRKLRMSWRETREFLALMRGLLDVAPVTVETHDLGLEFAERYGLSIYDSMIAAAAALNGSARLWSQDMQHGMRIGEGLRVENPFQ